MPEMTWSGEWWFDAGDQRFSMGTGSASGPDGQFGIDDGLRRVILHESVAGWVESLALAHLASYWAPQITKVRGSAVDRLDLSGLQPFPEVAGAADTWWKGADTVIAMYRGEADLFSNPKLQIATICGITEAPTYLDY